MLLVQTAYELLYVPYRDIASIMPAYPDRWRIVLADGRVGHRTGPAPTGPWVPLENGWVRPEHLRRQGDHWRDPAGFQFPYQPLDELEEEEETEDDLPAGLLTVEKREGAWVFRTDTGEIPCDLTRQQLTLLYPELAELNPSQLVYLPRVRRLRTTPPGPLAALDLDNGESLTVIGPCYFRLANRLGLESFVSLDLSVPETMWKLRDFPYDLTSANPDQISRDLPSELIYLQQLLWQVVVHNHAQLPNDYGRESASFAQHPMISSARRCGYPTTKKRIYGLIQNMGPDQELFTLRQLGFRELSPERRMTGSKRPEVLLLAPHPELEAARLAAGQAGISLLVTGNSGAIVQEYLAAELSGPLQLLCWKVPQAEIKSVRKRFAQLGLTTSSPVELEKLEDLPRRLKQLPQTPEAKHPFRRIPLQDFTGLYYADPEEIAAWTPTRPDRYQVNLKDGRILHHPGPPPPPPPDSPPGDRFLFLEKGKDGCTWHLDDGSQLFSPQDYLDAAQQHPSLVNLNKDRLFNYNRLRSSDALHLRLDDETAFPVPQRLWRRRLLKILGTENLEQLGPDPHGLRFLQLRDLPYEIIRANAAQLQKDFPGWTQLIANIVWQVYCGHYQYADTFQGFFYRPLQAVLYRAGYLTRAQTRGSNAVKERLYKGYCQLLTRMVRHYRLFHYREIGFVDPFPDSRILGDRQPQRILLVEKGDLLEKNARQLQRELGLTALILKGCPSLLATEYFCAALRQIHAGPVEVFYYGDFDEAGWDIGPAFIKQLLFYGIQCTRLERLILPQIFTLEEQMLYSRPLIPETLKQISRLERFLRESGGIQGQARGIHGNWLQPYSRVRLRLEELLK